MSEVSQVWMFHTGRTRVRRSWLEEGSHRELGWMPNLAFLLVHPEGPVLVDTGLGLRMLDRAGTPWGRVLSGAVRFTFAEGMDCRSRIRQCGIDPADVHRGILTHLHFDHTGGILDLPETTFHVSLRELEWAQSHDGPAAWRRGYAASELRRAPNLEPIDWHAADDLLPFDLDFDVYGDGAIRAFPTPGHSPGHLSVLVQARGGRQVLLTGDAAMTQRHIEGGLGFGLLPKRFAADLHEAEHSLHLLRAFVRRREPMLVLTSHDPDQGDDAAAGPVPVIEAD